jgi:hypothetical protein
MIHAYWKTSFIAVSGMIFPCRPDYLDLPVASHLSKRFDYVTGRQPHTQPSMYKRHSREDHVVDLAVLAKRHM